MQHDMAFLKALHHVWFPIRSMLSAQHLFKGFVTKEIKGRFAGSFAGISWTLLNPLATICVYMFLFSVVIRIPINAEENGTDSFLIFFLAGLFLWLFFADSLGRSLDCLTGNAGLITKVVFPVDLLPTSSLFSSLIIHSIGMVLYLAYIVVKGYFAPSWLWIGVLIPSHILFTWGLSLFLSALSVFVRDVKELMGIILMIWFYGSPILYPVSFLPIELQKAMLFNPLTLLIVSYRQALLSHDVNLSFIFIFVAISMSCFVLGALFFQKTKHAFADVL